MKKVICLLCFLLLCSGCTSTSSEKVIPAKKTYTWMDYFDTVSTLVSYNETDEDHFQEITKQVGKMLSYYNSLFDIYNSYSDMNNLYTVNQNAGEEVEVDQEMIDFLNYCEEIHPIVGDKFNIMLGPVLLEWHQFRDAIENEEEAELPDVSELQGKMVHCDWDYLKINSEKNTVLITDPEASLDVGGIAKGYVAQRIADYLLENDPDGVYMINLGGNVVPVGSKPDGSEWVVGLSDPNSPDSTIVKLAPGNKCVVTSGDYQRYVLVDGVKYHHIIDVDTLYPSAYWASVTVLGDDSGLCDALSTTLFCLSLDEGKEIIENLEGIEAFWIGTDGAQYYTDGFKEMLRS